MATVDLTGNRNITHYMRNDLRIVFRSTERAAEEDIRTFSAWAAGTISTEDGVRKVSHTNRIRITAEQFLANAQWLGYRRKGAGI